MMAEEFGTKQRRSKRGVCAQKTEQTVETLKREEKTADWPGEK